MRRLLLVVVLVGCAPPNDATPPPAPSPAVSPALSPSQSAQPTADVTGIAPSDAARLEPIAPLRLSAELEGRDVRMTWPATGEDVTYFRCLRRTPAGNWAQIGKPGPLSGAFTDHDPPKGIFIYGIQAVNKYGSLSAITQSLPITIP